MFKKIVYNLRDSDLALRDIWNDIDPLVVDANITGRKTALAKFVFLYDRKQDVDITLILIYNTGSV